MEGECENDEMGGGRGSENAIHGMRKCHNVPGITC